MSRDLSIEVKLSAQVTMCLFELSTDQVAMGFILAETSASSLDKYRPPLVFLDDQPVLDFGSSKAVQEIMARSDVLSVHYTFEPRSVSAVIWHGKKSEGLGFVGNFVRSRRMKVRLYLDDYTTAEFEVNPGTLQKIKQEIYEVYKISASVE